MTILYIHGVNVRSPEHGIELERSLQRWLGPKLSKDSKLPTYEPVYWGHLASRFRWDLASRPRTSLLGMGGETSFAGLGALREATGQTPLYRPVVRPTTLGPVLGTALQPDAMPVAPLSSVPRDRRADFLADLFLVCCPKKAGEDPLVETPAMAALADAAAAAEERWDQIVAEEQTDDGRAQRLLKAVCDNLWPNGLITMGGWQESAAEVVRRAASWPGDVVSTVFAETRPVLNRFIANFVGDVFTYLTTRGEANQPGAIPQLVLKALHRALERKRQRGEKIVIVSHSMGGQLVYDALTYFAPHAPELSDLEIDHWFTCGAQVSLFAELRLFLGQIDASPPSRLPRPASVVSWTNFYDLNDFVGFIMEPVFDGVMDIAYNTGYGLAFAHTGYLARPSFFSKMADRL